MQLSSMMVKINVHQILQYHHCTIIVNHQVLSRAAAARCQPLVHSYVHNDDIVSRLTPQAIVRLCEKGLAALANEEVMGR